MALEGGGSGPSQRAAHLGALRRAVSAVAGVATCTQSGESVFCTICRSDPRMVRMTLCRHVLPGLAEGNVLREALRVYNLPWHTAFLSGKSRSNATGASVYTVVQWRDGAEGQFASLLGTFWSLEQAAAVQRRAAEEWAAKADEALVKVNKQQGVSGSGSGSGGGKARKATVAELLKRQRAAQSSQARARPRAEGHNLVVDIQNTHDVMRFDVQMHFVQGTTAATVAANDGSCCDFDPAAGRGRLDAYTGTLAPAVRTILRASHAKPHPDEGEAEEGFWARNPFRHLPSACIATILQQLAGLPEYAPRVHCVLHWRWGGGYGAGGSRCIVLGAFSRAAAAEAFVDTLCLQCSAEGGRVRDWRPSDAGRGARGANDRLHQRAAGDAGCSDPDAAYRNFWRWATSIAAGYMRRTDSFAVLPVPVGRVRAAHVCSPHVGANPYNILPLL